MKIFLLLAVVTIVMPTTTNAAVTVKDQVLQKGLYRTSDCKAAKLQSCKAAKLQRRKLFR